MSRYVTYDIRAFRSQEVLLAALAALGYGHDKVEVHEQPQTLYGVAGDARTERANIIIRRQNTGIGASNDVGFLKQEDGTYRAIVSEYDASALRFGQDNRPLASGAWNSQALGFVDAVRKQYGKINGDRTIRTLITKTIPNMKARGIIPRNATITTQTVSGATKVLVTYTQ